MSLRAPSYPPSAHTSPPPGLPEPTRRLCARALPLAALAALGLAFVWSAPAAAQEKKPPKLLEKDDFDEAGYLPGYRHYSGLGLSPYTPQVPGMPSGFTPGFAAPMPTEDWNFTYSGYMTASLEVSTFERPDPQPGQSDIAL